MALPGVTDAWLRKFVRQAISAAGLTPWRCVFYVLRSSCEIDLADEYPEHVVSAWVGHDVRVARKHYLRPTDAHFMRAVGGGKAVQNPVQHGAADGCTEAHDPRWELASSGMQAGAGNKLPGLDSNQ